MKKKQNTVIAYIGLGSNLGDKAGNINSALNQLANTEGIFLIKFSKITETKPLGGKRQPNYFNAVAQIKTRLNPEKLLDKLQFIEERLGRVRNTEPNSSRTIDLDILMYDDQTVNLPNLKIPHPQMHLRSFVLEGLFELNPNIKHPVLGREISVLKERLNGNDFLIDHNKTRLISIAGVVGVGKTTLARNISVITDAHLIEENYKDNPYLAKVYEGRQEYALKSELYFVQDSVSQLGKEKLESDQIYVSDYIFEKAFVYANRWLNADDLAEYKQQYTVLEYKVNKASVVIYLKDSLTRCLERIKIRKRPFEQEITTGFLEELQADYDRLFSEWSRCPVITVDCREFNTKDIKNVRSLAEEIMMYIEGMPK